MNINDLQQECHAIALKKGWWEKERNIPELIALMHSELSEALEEYRNGKAETYFEGEKKKPCGLYSELADVVIRIMDFLEHDAVSLCREIEIKNNFNEGRSYRHGGKVC